MMDTATAYAAGRTTTRKTAVLAPRRYDGMKTLNVVVAVIVSICAAVGAATLVKGWVLH